MTTDKTLLRNRFAASFRSYNLLAVVQDEICGQLDDMLFSLDGGSLTIERALEIGAGTGFLTRRLLKRHPGVRWTVNDLVEQARPFVETYAGENPVEYLWGDAEMLSLPGGQDLVASASTVQWFDDLPAFIRRARETLRPGGILALSSFGPENFREIKTLTGEGLSYYGEEDFQTLLAGEGFETVRWMAYTRQLAFADPREVLRHIRATGVNSIRPARWTRKTLESFETRYRERYTTPEGLVTLTYHPILAVGIKK